MSKRCAWMVAITVISVLMSAPALAAGYQPLKIEPSRLVFEGKPGEQITGSIIVRNKGEEATTPKAILSDWTLDTSNKLVVMDAGSLDSSLDGWIKFNPRQFNMKPDGAQTVRFTIKIPQDAKPGERRGMIVFEQTVPYSEGGTGATARVQVTTTIYVAVLPVTRQIDIVGLGIQSDETAKSSIVVLQLKGTGTAHYRGSGGFIIYPEKGDTPKASGNLEPIVVMPDVTTRFAGSFESILKPGRYRLAVEIISEEPGSLPINRVYPFEVK